MTIEIPQDDPVTPTEARKDALMKAYADLLNHYLGGEQIELEIPAGPIKSLRVQFRGTATKEALAAAITILRQHKILLPSGGAADHMPPSVVAELEKALEEDRAARAKEKS